MAFPKSRLSFSCFLRWPALAIFAGSAEVDGLNGLPNCPAIFSSSSLGTRLRSSALKLIFLGGRCGVAVCTPLPLVAVGCVCFPDANVCVPPANARMPFGIMLSCSKRANVTSHLTITAVNLAVVATIL